MKSIAKIDLSTGLVDPQALAHPSLALWLDPANGLLIRIAAEIHKRAAHPARTVVLLPYAQLIPLATRLWVQRFPDGFAPQFQTTMNWSAALGAFNPGATDIAFDMALDTLTAQALLRSAGLGAQQDALAGLLVEAAQQLGPLAAARSPAERMAWAQGARQSALIGMDGPALAMEAAVARIAVEWAALSSYASDALFDIAVRDGLDGLLVVQGFAADALTPALQEFWGNKLAGLSLASELTLQSDGGASAIAWHACGDSEDEAQRAAACAIQHIAAGRFPLALVSTDRALTRRVRSMLEGTGVQIRDENGWKLSTSHAAAQVVALLKAGVWNASTDGVLGWLKGAPAFAAEVSGLEAALRQDQVRDWRGSASAPSVKKSPAVLQAYAAVGAVLEPLCGSRPLVGWLDVLRTALQSSGLWEGLQTDGAGIKVLAALRLTMPPMPAWEHLLGQALWASRRVDLAEFTGWVNQALEGASFSPPYPDHEQVVILPMSQMLARPFAALVLAGCDEVRFNPSPEPPGGWTSQQRAALELPSRDALQAATEAAWHHALLTPYCDVLWRCSDDTGETLLPSSLVQLMQLARTRSGAADHADHAESAVQAADPRTGRSIAPRPVLPPLPTGELVPVSQLSASAYDDLRHCPYRFFALRQLGLKSVDELDAEIGKRDFGLWLHEVLTRFHEALASLAPTTTEKRLLLDDAAAATTDAMGLGEGEFLPFAAAWPAVRDGYLRWLSQHEATGAVFVSAETAQTQRLGDVKLVGRIDRIDKLTDGTLLVLDYKTEPTAKTSARVKEPLEDTQIAFYAALLPQDTLQAAYVNVGERDATRTYAQADVVDARDALIEGILHDMARIGQGAPLPALGDGSACDYCQARGLCRKDFWSEPACLK